MPTSPKLFVSYARTDKRWIAELRIHLVPLARADRVSSWDDTHIRPGEKWEDVIKNALDEADIAVLLVTPHFLASNYISENELPELLKKKGIIWIAVSASNYQETPLGELQCVNDPAKPLATLAPAARDAEWVKICNKILTVAAQNPQGGTKLRFHVPYERNPFFTGREPELTALSNTLASHHNATLTQAISGLGGMGKTQVAIEYAFRCLQRQEGYPPYTYFLWTRAETTTDLLNGYTQIAAALQLALNTPEDPWQVVAAVRHWLENHQNWLLIYDNADNPDLLDNPLEPARSFRPRNTKGHLLLTSRAHTFKGHLGIIYPIELTSLPLEEAVRFLFNRTHRSLEATSPEERKAAADLAQELGGFPLALEQAAAYVRETEQSFRVYLATFRRREQELLNAAPPETGDYRDEVKHQVKTVRTTWDLNFQAVEADGAASAELLRFSAFLAPDDIPQELIITGASKLGPPLADIFTDLPEEEHEDAYDQLLAPLLRYSLLEKNREVRTFSVHRMVQSVQRERLQDQQYAWAERVVRAVYAAFPNAEFTNWPLCSRLLSHALACLAHARNAQVETVEMGQLCNRVGYYLDERGQYADAEPHYLQALKMWRKTLPEGHPDIAYTLTDLAYLYERQGRYSEAEPLYREASEILRKTLPEGHPDIAASLHNLAALYERQGRYSEAEPLYREASEILRKTLPEGHPDIASNLNNQATLYASQGRYDLAEPLFSEALEMRCKALPEGHPHIAQSLHNLAGLYTNQGRDSEAEPLYREALEMRRKAFPEGHPDIAANLNNLAELYRIQGRYDQAEPLYRETLEMLRKTLPEGHPNIASTLNNLALLYQDQECYDLAEPLYREAQEMARKTLPEGHPSIGTSLNNLAGLYKSQGRYSEAEPLYREALAILVKALGPQHPTTQIVLENTVTILKGCGKPQEVEALLTSLNTL